MSKKINLGTINAKSINKLSAYHVAYLELKSLRDVYKTDMDNLIKEESQILNNRKVDLENGLDTDDVIRKWSTEDVHTRMRKREEKYKKDCEPHNKAKKNALDLIPDALYHAYVLSMKKGSLSATGTLVIEKKKSTKKYKIEKSFKGCIRDFLDKIGCKNQDNDTALAKFANTMSIRTAGMVRNSKGEDYIKVKSASQFKEIFMLAFLQYTIIEKGVFTINDDGKLSMTVYEEK